LKGGFRNETDKKIILIGLILSFGEELYVWERSLIDSYKTELVSRFLFRLNLHIFVFFRSNNYERLSILF